MKNYLHTADYASFASKVVRRDYLCNLNASETGIKINLKLFQDR